MKAIVVYSGGLDSTVLLVKAKREYAEVEAINFNYGSKHNMREREAAITICEELDIPLILIDLDFIGELFKSDLLKSGGEIPEGHYAADNMKSTVVPFRNGIMLSIAAGYAESVGAQKILLASHAGDHSVYPDCRPMFNNAMNIAISYGTTSKVRLQAPFEEKSKTDIARLGIELGAPLHLTYSCYKGEEHHCGKCGTCVERIEAFKQVGYIDPVGYDIIITWCDCRPYPMVPPDPKTKESSQAR